MTHRGLACLLVGVCILGPVNVVRCPRACGSPATDSESARAGHVLNRIAYGPSPTSLAHVAQIGVERYIEEQLHPAGIDESANVRLREREDALFTEEVPVREIPLIAAGVLWRYHKGTTEPAPGWSQVSFDDTDWLEGPTGIGYGDGDDETVLEDMRRLEDDPATEEDEGRPGYASVFLRRTFRLTDELPSAIDKLILRIDYDDGFKAYLNGTEIARVNLPAGDVPHDRTAGGSHEAGAPEEFDISQHKDLLRLGDNILAIQVHNQSLSSGDLSMIPELLSQEVLPGPTRRVVRGISELQQLMHIRGVYSQRQLQTVLAEFWENHFTTDYDKLVNHLDHLENSDATDAMSTAQARAEAAQLEYEEYQFFFEHALGDFGDLLLYSATSPSMLVYLDNVLNVKGQANENYAREILELHTFGVDNRYTQADIEQLAKCFTGWSLCKVRREEAPVFPASALSPPEQCGVLFEETVTLDRGPGWRYFKGTTEPSPGIDGGSTTAWTEPGFDDAVWLDGETGIGYGDDDDATVLPDMRGNYLSVYLRRRFTVEDPSQLSTFILEVAYDDGFVAYLNGVEVARSATMENVGSPPAHDRSTAGSHEVTRGAERFDLRRFMAMLVPGENVLAIQVHNASLDSSDLSMLPKLIDRALLPGSIENGDRNAVWTFRFRADQHDTDEKVLFRDTPHERVIPAGREGQNGLLDAMDVVQSMVSHPSTAEFICIKLIQKFASDESTLAKYKAGAAPAELVALLEEAVAAWNSTEPAGNIATVMRAILDPVNESNAFWADIAYRSKVKTAIEYINSSLRVLEADAAGAPLAGLNDDMGMELFIRDAPDGYSELGADWVDTTSMLARIEFVNELAENRNTAYRWDAATFVDGAGLRTPEDVVDFFDEVFFQSTLSDENRALLLAYVTTGEDGEPLPLDPADEENFDGRVRELVGLMLSLPQWHYQ